MQKIPKLILQLCDEATNLRELAEKMHELRLIDVHKLKYLVIYKYYQQQLEVEPNIMGAMYATAAYFNVSIRMVQKVRKYVGDYDLALDCKDILNPPQFI